MSPLRWLLLVSVWAWMPAAVRSAEPVAVTPVPTHAPCADDGSAGHGGWRGHVRHCISSAGARLGRLAEWACYRSPGRCRNCCNTLCQPEVCCQPQLFAFFLHHCAGHHGDGTYGYGYGHGYGHCAGCAQHR